MYRRKIEIRLQVFLSPKCGYIILADSIYTQSHDKRVKDHFFDCLNAIVWPLLPMVHTADVSSLEKNRQRQCLIYRSLCLRCCFAVRLHCS